MSRHVWLAALISGVLAVYLLRLDSVAGLFVDDAWYLVLAKAIASGEGYALISSAAAPILPAFPPGFPLLLAPVFAINPDFPANVVWLKAVPIVAMFGVGAATYLFLVRYRAVTPSLATAVALLTVLTPAFVFLATSTVMSEAAFTLGQLAVVLTVERAAREAQPVRSRLAVGLAAAIGVATLLIRMAGIATLVAGAGYLAVKRGWRFAGSFIAVAAICYLPWGLYAASHRPDEEAQQAHGGAVAHAYSELLSMRRGGDPGSGPAGLADLPGRVGANLVNVFGRDLGALTFPAGYRGANESGMEVLALGGEKGLGASSMGGAAATVAVSVLLSAIIVLGYVRAARLNLTVVELIVPLTVAMVALVPSATFRYVLPLTPFVLFYFFTGLETLTSAGRAASRRNPDAVLRISGLCLLLLVAAEHAQYVWQARTGPSPVWLQEHAEVAGLIDWMNRSLPPEGAVATTNPGLVYLLTGRRTVAIDGIQSNRNRWQAMGVKYAVALRTMEKPPASLGYRVAYESPQLKFWVLALPATPSR